MTCPHAVEGLSSPNSNEMIDAIDEACIRLIVENLPRVDPLIEYVTHED